MITNLKIKKSLLEKSKKYKFFMESPLFKDERFSKDGETVSIDFKPGINIVIGENGAGKSTIFKMITDITASYKGGVSTYTSSWFGDIGYDDILSGITGKINALPFYSYDSKHSIGLYKGHFDDDFISEGIKSLQTKGSSGQVSSIKIDHILNIIKGKEKPITEYDSKCNVQWQIDRNKNTIVALERIKSNMIESGITTLLFDEPELHISLEKQSKLWDCIHSVFGKQDEIQVIVVSHSPFAFADIFRDAHYIEITKGYREKYRKLISNLSFSS